VVPVKQKNKVSFFVYIHSHKKQDFIYINSKTK
jgi:hypothetical protein